MSVDFFMMVCAHLTQDVKYDVVMTKLEPDLVDTLPPAQVLKPALFSMEYFQEANFPKG
jgi:hypothetical protein